MGYPNITTVRHHKKLAVFAALVLVGLIGTVFNLKTSAAAQTANLWINNTATGSCTRSATKITYAEALSASKVCTATSFQTTLAKTVNGAVDSDGKADTIVVKGGTGPYSANISSLSRSPAVTIYAESGTQSTLSGGSFIGVDGVTIDGTTGSNQQGFIEAGAGGGFDFGANQQPAANNIGLKGVRTRGELYMLNCSNITIDKVEIYNKTDGEDSIQMSGWYEGPGSYSHFCANVTFDHMNIHDISCPGTNGDHLDFIQILAGHDITMQNSRLNHLTCHGSGSGAQGFFVSCGFDNGSQGGCHDINLINSEISGIDPQGGGGNIAIYQVNKSKIINNTIDGDVKTESSPSPPSNVTFANNLTNSPCAGINILFSRVGTGTYANNVLTGNCGHSAQGDQQISGTWASMFVGAGSPNYDYHLNSGAYAIGKANASLAPATDADDLTRTSPPDAGAYEFGGTTGGGGGGTGTYTPADLSSLISHYGTKTGMTTSTGDLNGDGATNVVDMSILLADYSG